MNLFNQITNQWTAVHSVQLGWLGIFSGFLSGMVIGLIVWNDKNMGGYASIKRRYIRLGHIAMAALGMINVLAGLTVQIGLPLPPQTLVLLGVGLITMPITCFIYAFNKYGFYLFPLPATSLTAAAYFIFMTLKELPK